ncbi:L-seryl-tRNA(Sec) selenium transferase [Fusobacterium sp.]|uniref:L-seryl-tRNA(Sec) selenium transferase n=1 Tax=Fusobacterium sp. TaxID=68766 RepID=UPI002626E3E7|nr:L-seryl-tRNA(Sec) selenium transferase [Fusobacterium sp.]
MKKILLRNLPKVDIILKNKEIENMGKSVDYYTFLSCIKKSINQMREEILKTEDEEKLRLLGENLEENIIKNILSSVEKEKRKKIQRVFNGSGTILHTNLGRSVFSKKIGEKIGEILSSYNNLEYDIEEGKRGSRYKNLENLISQVVGSESALVVNNNAGAVILCLNEFSKNKNTIISRGELVEIGGSFRVPEIIKFSGANLLEVGATNITHLDDYERNIDEETGVLLKVHTSNYKIKGFTQEVDLKELVKLGKDKNKLVIEDIGSGNLVEFSKYGIVSEPTVMKSLEAGVDLVTFSGDKLLGGCQAGIIVGKKELIDRLKKNQFLRAIRVDKITIALLEELFTNYLDEREAIKNIPTLRMITEKVEDVEERAIRLSNILEERGIKNKVIETKATIGGGSMPDEEIKSFGIEFLFNKKISPNRLEEYFRKNKISIIGRIEDNRYFLDMKTIFLDDIDELAQNIQNIFLERGLV